MSQKLWDIVVKPERILLAALYANSKNAVTIPHRIGKFVTQDGSPSRKRIMVFNRGTGALLRMTFSNKDTGEWEMKGLFEGNPNMPTDPKKILVVAVDDEREFNGEVIDFVTRKPDKVT